MGQQIPSRPEQLSLPTKLRAPPGPMEALIYGLYKLIAQHALQVAVYGQQAPSFEEWMGLTPVQRIARVIEASEPGSTGKVLFEQAVPCDVPPIPSPSADVISAVYGSSPDALPSGLLEACASTVAVTVDSSVIEYLGGEVRTIREPEEAAKVVHRVSDVVCASKPTLKPQDRIIRSTARLVQFAVDSVYASRYAPAVAIHSYVSDIYQSLPDGRSGVPRGVKAEAWSELMARADRLDAHTTCAELMDANFNVVCCRVTFRFMEACSGGDGGENSMTIADKEYAGRLVDGMAMEAGSQPRSELFWQKLLDIVVYIVKHGLSKAVALSQVYSNFCDQLVGQDSLPEALQWAVEKWREEGGEVDDWIAEAAIKAIDSADALRYDIGIERARRLLKLSQSSRATKLSELLDICALVFDLLSYREFKGPGIGGKLVGQAVNVVLKAAAPNARASFRDFAFSTPHDIRMLLATHSADEASFKLLNAVVAYNLQSLGDSDGLRKLSESISPGSWSRGGLLLVCQYSLSDHRVTESIEYTKELKRAGYGNCWRLAAAVLQGGGVVGDDESKEMDSMVADGVTTCSDDDIYDALETVRATSQYLNSEASIHLPVVSDEDEWAKVVPDWPPRNFQGLKTDYTLPGSTLGGGIFSSEGCDVSQLMDLCSSVKPMPQGSLLPKYSIAPDEPVVDAGIGLLSDDPELAGMLLRLGARPEEVDEKLLCPVLNSDVMSLTEKRHVVAFVRSLSVPGSPRVARLDLLAKLLDRCVPLKAEYRYLSVAHLAGDEDYREAVLLRISRQLAASHRDSVGSSAALQKALAVLAQLDGDDEIPDDSDTEFCDDVSTPSASGDWDDMINGSDEDLVARIDDPDFIAKVAGSSSVSEGNHRSYNRTAAVLALEQLCTVLTTNLDDPCCEGAAMKLFPKCIESPALFEDRLRGVVAELAARTSHSEEEENQLVQRYFLARRLLDIAVAGGSQLTEALARLHTLLPGLNVRRVPLSAEDVLRQCAGSLPLTAEVCVVVDGVSGLGFEAGDLADLAVERKSVFETVPALLRAFVRRPMGGDGWVDGDEVVDSVVKSPVKNDWDLDGAGDGGWDDELNVDDLDVGGGDGGEGDDEDILSSGPEGWDF
ncbi:hypothetical protein FOZ63_022230 [Perkinsus olseni]|uniref:Uncharacterized protein n=1 Tax=Perkinsus olseni TaxID=32597 RepID=A0A7J6TQI3_PEROL|nr:hypothetical protein FOZ63_022230 [Perkinsus olseni]